MGVLLIVAQVLTGVVLFLFGVYLLVVMEVI